MSTFENDVYHNPEKFGLELIGEVSWNDEPWQFELTVVWRDEHGNFYWADDSGCSCPSPFERANKLSDLKKGTKWGAVQHISKRHEKERHLSIYNHGAVAEITARIAMTGTP